MGVETRHCFLEPSDVIIHERCFRTSTRAFATATHENVITEMPLDCFALSLRAKASTSGLSVGRMRLVQLEKPAEDDFGRQKVHAQVL